VNLEEILSKAAEAEKQNQWTQAADLYKQALAHAPDNQPAKEQLAWCLSRSKNYEAAIALYQDLWRLQPTNPQWAYSIGYQYHEQEQWQTALQWFDKALNLSPDFVVVLYRKGYAHFKLGQVREALRAFERCRTCWRALPDGPRKEKDRKNCAKAAYHQAEVMIENPRQIIDAFNGAIVLLEEAIELDPKNHHAHYLYGKALLASGRADQAVAAFAEADRLQPDQDYVLDRWGQAFAQLKRFDDAERVYQRIPPHRRKDYILRNLGQLQYNQGDYTRAIATLQQAVQKNRRNHYAHYYLGLSYRERGELNLAVLALREAIQQRQRNYRVPFREAEEALNDILSQHPEARDSPKSATPLRGTVAKYFEDRGFGFIQASSGQIFFHIKDCRRGLQIEEGMIVEYDEAMGDKGPKALNVRPVASDKQTMR
jgi:tetratricopeptide (TPR) repeat protein